MTTRPPFSRRASMAARQAARRRLEQPVRFFPQRWQRKFSVQPFFKRLAGWRGSAPPRPPQRAKLHPRCASGATQNKEKAARRPPADVPAAAISKKLRHDTPLLNPKRKPAPASRSVCTFLLAGAGFVCAFFAGLRPAGNPLIGFPLGPTAHRAVGPSLPDLLGSVEVSPSAEGDQRLCLWNLPAF